MSYERAWNDLLILLDKVNNVCTQININKLIDYMQEMESEIDYDNF